MTPLLQLDNTIKFLKNLEKSKHNGPVVIITKGDFSKFPKIDFDLDLHFAFSTFGLENSGQIDRSKYDGSTFKRFLNNLETAKKIDKYKYSIEFRPIIFGINDSIDSISSVINTAHYYKLPVGYSGLQGKPNVVKYWEAKNYDFKPYPGYSFGHKKSLSDEVKSDIISLAKEKDVNVFSKTSCLLSYTHKLNRDYNSHYYRPNEVGCFDCVMKNKCFKAKEKRYNMDKFYNEFKDVIPFNFDIIIKSNHECILKKKGICEFPTEDCSKISGPLIKINEQITTADVRVIKWITGFTVDADFVEQSYLSKVWIKE